MSATDSGNTLPRLENQEITNEMSVDVLKQYHENTLKELGANKLRASIQLVVVKRESGSSDLLLSQVIGTSDDLATLLSRFLKETMMADAEFRKAMMAAQMQQLEELMGMVESTNARHH